VGGKSALLAVVAIGFGLGGAGSAAAEPTPLPPVPAPPADHGSPAAPGPVAIDHDGTFAIGTQILPGVYTSAGPLPGDTCYWRRIGGDDNTVDNALSKKPQVVQIDAGDVAFKTNGCQPWQLTPGAAPPNQNPPWLSQLQLRHNLDILNGLAGQSGNGVLPPY
jgi:hypothetical protein